MKYDINIIKQLMNNTILTDYKTFMEGGKELNEAFKTDNFQEDKLYLYENGEFEIVELNEEIKKEWEGYE